MEILAKEGPVVQKPRIQVRVSPIVRKIIEPVFTDRAGSPYVVEVAEEIGLLECMKLLSEEPQAESGRNEQISVTPTERLEEHAARMYVSAHLLCRAATVKIAQAISEGATGPKPKRGRGRPPKVTPTVPVDIRQHLRNHTKGSADLPNTEGESQGDGGDDIDFS